MALESFFYGAQEFNPHTPPWRREDDRFMWRMTLVFESPKESNDMIIWCNNTFGKNNNSADSEWNYVYLDRQALKLSLFSIEQYTLFKMTWLV